MNVARRKVLDRAIGLLNINDPDLGEERMTELKTRLTWNEVEKDREWHAGGLARFYKIVYWPVPITARPQDTHRSDFFSLYLSYPEGMDHYIGPSWSHLENAKKAAQEHADRAR